MPKNPAAIENKLLRQREKILALFAKEDALFDRAQRLSPDSAQYERLRTQALNAIRKARVEIATMRRFAHQLR